MRVSSSSSTSSSATECRCTCTTALLVRTVWYVYYDNTNENGTRTVLVWWLFLYLFFLSWLLSTRYRSSLCCPSSSKAALRHFLRHEDGWCRTTGTGRFPRALRWCMPMHNQTNQSIRASLVRLAQRWRLLCCCCAVCCPGSLRT